MTKELFLNWICHFIASILGGVSLENRQLLILDDHGSQIGVQTIEEVNKLGIDLLMLPTHTNRKLQPLNVSVFGPFKSYFRSKQASWMKKNLGLEVKKVCVSQACKWSFQKGSQSLEYQGQI